MKRAEEGFQLNILNSTVDPRLGCKMQPEINCKKFNLLTVCPKLQGVELPHIPVQPCVDIVSCGSYLL